jgi:hypothetical protein
MQYQLSGINTHLDFGFGITGEAYYNSAEYLHENKENITTFQQIDMPTNFLYRHSIELFLKSLIIILHKTLKLKYNTEPYDTNRPKILIGGAWKELYTCHWIDELYNYWLNELLLKYQLDLQKMAPQGEWQEDTSISNFFPLIAGYDRDSSYFRYPVTKNSQLDLEKFTMKPLDLKNLESIFNDEDTRKKNKGGGVFMLFKNDEDKIVNGFVKETDVLKNVTQALKKVSYYFYCMHIMTRVTLCQGS